jgi:hypothetical protein
MVKIKFKIVPKKDSPENRVRGLKQNKKDTNIETTQKISHTDLNQNALTDEPNLKYHPEDRHFIFIGILDLFEKVNAETELPENLIFSAIAFFDKYLEKTEKVLSKKEMVSALYACLDILDKEQNINIFTHEMFKPFFTFETECEILETVDLEVYPEKLYDHFQKMYFFLTQIHQIDSNFMKFVKEFKKIFLNFAFFLLFHNESKKKTPISNFISCCILSYEKCKNTLPQESTILKECIEEIKKNNNYSDNDSEKSRQLIDESICNFNKIYREIKNKK